MSRKAQPAIVQGLGSEMRVVYPDARLAPRICERTHMKRQFCPCSPCRALRRRKHGARCRCWLCFSDRMGALIDRLGHQTSAGRWLWFVTLTFRTPHYPWSRGFPVEQPEPCSDFVRHFFEQMISWIEREVHCRVEYFVADQFGEVGGRLHQHCGLSFPGLFQYRWKDLQNMLWQRSGFNRILPWEMDAGYYIGRYIARDAERCQWNFRVGPEPISLPMPVGRRLVAVSPVPEQSSRAYRQNLGRWHR